MDSHNPLVAIIVDDHCAAASSQQPASSLRTRTRSAVQSVAPTNSTYYIYRRYMIDDVSSPLVDGELRFRGEVVYDGVALLASRPEAVEAGEPCEEEGRRGVGTGRKRVGHDVVRKVVVLLRVGNAGIVLEGNGEKKLEIVLNDQGSPRPRF